MALYVLFSGLTGDSTDANFPGTQGWFNATSFTWSPAPAGGGQIAATSPVTALSISRNSSQGSPDLMLAWAEGFMFTSIVIEQTTGSGSGERPAVKLTLSGVTVSAYAMMGEATAPQTETVSLKPNAFTYQQYWNNGANSETHSFNFGTNSGS